MNVPFPFCWDNVMSWDKECDMKYVFLKKAPFGGNRGKNEK